MRQEYELTIEEDARIQAACDSGEMEAITREWMRACDRLGASWATMNTIEGNRMLFTAHPSIPADD